MARDSPREQADPPPDGRRRAARTLPPTADRWRVDVMPVIRYPGHPIGPIFVKGPMGKPKTMTWAH
jgi:hypothetical protein